MVYGIFLLFQCRSRAERCPRTGEYSQSRLIFDFPAYFERLHSRTFGDGTELSYVASPGSMPLMAWSAPWPVEILVWAMLASRRAHSEWHVDANGLGTYVHQIEGWKIWIIAGSWKIPSKYGDTWDDEVDLKHLEVVLLGPGDQLWVVSPLAESKPHMASLFPH